MAKGYHRGAPGDPRYSESTAAMQPPYGTSPRDGAQPRLRQSPRMELCPLLERSHKCTGVPDGKVSLHVSFRKGHIH
jgi:hypothetical protein